MKTVPRVASLVAFFFPLAIYIRTLAREITFTDSGELAAAAATLGIAHPPGYPLFTLLGRLASLVPVSTVAFRVGLVSAFSAALATLLIYRLGYALIERPRRAPGRRKGGSVGRHRALAASLGAAPLAGALFFAFSRTPWSQAVVVEVYALQAFLVIAFLGAAYLALATSIGTATGSRRLTCWLLVGFSFGLALTNHLTGALLLPALVLLLALGWRARAGGSWPGARGLLAVLAAAAFPLLLYLALPLRSRQSPPINWNYPEDLHGFFVHVTARQYHGLFGSKGIRGEELGRFLGGQLPSEATWVFVALAALGLIVLFRKRAAFGAVTAVSVVTFVIYNMGYPIHDIAVYYVSTLAVLALWAAIGAGALVELASRMHPLAPPLAAVALCLSSLLPLATHWRENDQRDFKLIAHYFRDTLRYLEPDAVLFTGRWDTISSPALYYQVVEGYRPDVVVLDMGRLAVRTFERQLSIEAPDLARACREEIAAMAEVARSAELGRPYDVGEGRRRLRAVLRKLALEAVARRPTYVTSDLHGHAMFGGLYMITEGLVSRVAAVDTLRPFPLPEFEGPGLRQADARDAREREIILEYGRMLMNRATALDHHGKPDEARFFRERAREVVR